MRSGFYTNRIRAHSCKVAYGKARRYGYETRQGLWPGGSFSSWASSTGVFYWKAQLEDALMLTIEIAARRGFGMVSLRYLHRAIGIKAGRAPGARFFRTPTAWLLVLAQHAK